MVYIQLTNYQDLYVQTVSVREVYVNIRKPVSVLNQFIIKVSKFNY